MASSHRKRGRPREIEDPVLLRVRVPRSVAEEIDRIAADQFCDRSDVMRAIMARGLARARDKLILERVFAEEWKRAFG